MIIVLVGHSCETRNDHTTGFQQVHENKIPIGTFTEPFLKNKTELFAVRIALICCA
jgi:hypothetical protein